MWEASKYKNLTERRMSKTFQQFQPDFTNLCIIGKEVKKQEDDDGDFKSTTSTDETLGSPAEKSDFSGNDKVVVAIKFGDDVISSETTEPLVKKYYFHVDYLIPYDGIVQNRIHLTNVGNIVVYMHWKKIEPSRTLDVIPKREPAINFVFNKIGHNLLLGECTYLTIYFSTNTPGFYKEIWEMETVPPIPNVRFLLILWAGATFAPHRGIINNLNFRLEEGMKNKIVDDKMVELLSRVHILNPEVDHVNNEVVITEKNIFESLNMDPKYPTVYYYNTYVVSVLKQIYKEVRQSTDPEEWNLKVDDLKKVVSKIDDPYQRNGYRKQLSAWLKKLLKTDMIHNIDREKYSQVYYLLCATIDQISKRIKSCREKFNVQVYETFPEMTVETIHDECQKPVLRKIEFFINETHRNQYEKQVLEKACDNMETLKNVSINDPEVLHKIYQKEKYGIDTEPLEEKGQKGKNGKETKGKKEKLDKKSKEGSKKPEPLKKKIVYEDKLLSLTDLIPKTDKVDSLQLTEETIQPPPDFLEEYNPESEYESYEPLYQSETELQQFDEYKHNIYLITYELLGNVVNDIELTMSIYNDKVIRHNLLKRIIDQPLDDWKKETIFDSAPKHLEETDSISQIFDKISLSSVCSSKSVALSPMVEDGAQTSPNTVDVFTETSSPEIRPPKTKQQFVQTVYAGKIIFIMYFNSCFDFVLADIDKEYLVNRVEIEEKSTNVVTY